MWESLFDIPFLATFLSCTVTATAVFGISFLEEKGK